MQGKSHWHTGTGAGQFHTTAWRSIRPVQGFFFSGWPWRAAVLAVLLVAGASTLVAVRTIVRRAR